MKASSGAGPATSSCELGGFLDAVDVIVHDHHERLDGRGLPARAPATTSISTRGSSPACDVYDALISKAHLPPGMDARAALAFLPTRRGRRVRRKRLDALERVVASNPVCAGRGYQRLP